MKQDLITCDPYDPSDPNEPSDPPDPNEPSDPHDPYDPSDPYDSNDPSDPQDPNLVPRAFPSKNGWGGKRPWHRLVTCLLVHPKILGVIN